MKVAVLGTGLMGAPIAARLLTQGHQVTVYNRTVEKAKVLESQGAIVANSVLEAVQAADFILTMLTDAAALEATLLSPDILNALQQKTVIQMGTIAPHESQAIAQTLQTHRVTYLEAPVLGSIPEAKAGTLLVLVGADHLSDLESVQPILQDLGENPVYFGAIGTGAAAKLALNQLIGSLTSAFSVSLALVQRHEVNLDAFMTVLRQSALYAPTFDKKLQRMLDDHFDNPNFPTKHLLKDMQLADQAAQAQGIDTQLLQAVIQIAQTSCTHGDANQDYSAIFRAIAQPQNSL